jgi:hypothetical protein
VVNTLLSSVYVGTTQTQPLTLSIAGLPSAHLLVTLRIDSAVAAIYPREFLISNNSASALQQKLFLTGVSAGDFTFAVELSGPSAAEYTVMYTGSTQLRVLRATDEPAAPSLLAAQFSNDGSNIVVSFDSPTDRSGFAGVFPCRLLLSFPGDADATCAWSSDANILVYPTYGEEAPEDVLRVGSTLVVLGGVLRASCPASASSRCSSWNAVTSAAVQVTSPSAASAPAVVLTAPLQVSACNALSLDVSASTGSAGRPWESVTFQVRSASGDSTAAQQLQRFLNQNYTVSPPTKVPPSVLVSGQTFSIQATLCNFLGACGSAAAAVAVQPSELAVPVVRILGSGTRTVLRKDALVLSSDAFVQLCGGAKTYTGMSYRWTVLARRSGDSVATQMTALRSVSQNAAVFKLPAYSLEAGTEYDIVLSVNSTRSAVSSTASVRILSASAGVAAILSGGSRLYAQVGDTITVDGSSSYDLDSPVSAAAAAAAAGLSFQWSCVQTAPAFSASCPVTLDTSAVSKAVGEVKASALSTAFVVTLTVTNRAFLSTSTKVEVVVTGAPAPRLQIAQSPSPLTKVDPGKQLALLGTVASLVTCTARWSVDDASISLRDISRTPTTQLALPASATPLPFNLVLSAGSLPQRATLVFTLSCDNTTTSVVVTTNGAPLPGRFVTSPPSGSEMETPFTLSASRWQDPDLPLTYQFGFTTGDSQPAVLIAVRSEEAYATTTLPAGRQLRGNMVICSVEVFDSLGASVKTTAEVKVTAVAPADKITALTSLLQSSDGGIDDTRKILSVATTALNSADCSNAPNCTRLNRAACSTTAGHCGSCLQGFTGDAGDRNTLCMPSYALANATATSCLADSDCRYWQRCNGASRQCEALPKSCSSSCSGHGRCVFSDKVYGGTLPSCTLADRTCDAVCVCDDQFAGDFCKLDSAALSQRQAIWSSLVGSLSNLTRLEDINAEAVASWSTSLYSLTVRPHELSTADVRSVSALANATLHHALLLGIQEYSDITGVLDAINALSSVQQGSCGGNGCEGRRLMAGASENAAASALPIISAFGDLVLGTQVLGVPPRALLYDNFRLSATLAQVSNSAENVSLTVPQSSSEEPTSVVTLQAAEDAASAVLGVKMIVMNPTAYSADTSAFVSTPVLLQVQTQGDDARSARDALSRIHFVFKHNEAQDHYVHYTSANLTTTCTERNASQQFSFVCPDSGHVLQHNCSRGAGVQTSYCPRPASACARLDYATTSISLPSTCSVIDYNATHTTCTCSLAGAPHDRRQLAAVMGQSILDDSGAADMMVSTVYIASNFANTFNSADDLTSPGAAARVIVVIILLGTLWVPALLFIGFDWFQPARKVAADKDKGALPDAKARVLRYVRSIVPPVYTTDLPPMKRMWDEIAQHHTLFSVFTSKNAYKRREIVCKMLTIMTFMLFLTSVFFDVSNPGDDGTCAGNSNEQDCLSNTSPFDGSRTFCVWSDESQTCSYNSESMSMKALFYVTVLTTVLTSLATVPIDYCFQVLSAPTAAGLKSSKAATLIAAMVSGARRMSNAGSAAARQVAARVPFGRNGKQNKTSLFGLSLGSGDTIIANRELSAEFRQHAEDARQQLATVAQATLAAALRDEVLRNQRKAKLSRIAYDDKSGKSRTVAVGVRDAEPAVGVSASLLNDIILQRLQMNDQAEDTVVFDAQWGIQKVSLERGKYVIPSDVEECIIEELTAVEKESLRLAETIPNYSTEHAGLEILHLFMVDLLGRNTAAAKIFKEKFSEEFGRSGTVMLTSKYAAAALLVSVNAFFIYFILLKGLQKGQAWQLQYLVCALIQVVIDVLVFETTECVWLNFLVPRTVDTEVVTAAATLTTLAERIVNPAEKSTKNPYFLNAAAQLFISVKVAKSQTHLSESLIVGSYSSPLPGEVCKSWPHYQAVEEQREVAVTRSVFPRSFLRGLTLAVQVCLTIPYLYQRILLRFIQPVIFSMISTVWLVTLRRTSTIIGLSCAVGIVVAYICWRQYAAHRNVISVQPSTSAAHASAVAVPTFKDAIEGDEIEITGAGSSHQESDSSTSSSDDCADDINQVGDLDKPLSTATRSIERNYQSDKLSLSSADKSRLASSYAVESMSGRSSTLHSAAVSQRGPVGTGRVAASSHGSAKGEKVHPLSAQKRKSLASSRSSSDYSCSSDSLVSADTSSAGGGSGAEKAEDKARRDSAQTDEKGTRPPSEASILLSSPDESLDGDAVLSSMSSELADYF